MKKLVRSEHDEQAALVRWFRVQYPIIANALFAIPNGSHLAGNTLQRAKKMQIMKSEGLLPGVSDLFLMAANDDHHGLFIEMKRKSGGTVSNEQAEFIKRAIAQGYKAVVCKGFDEAMNTIKEYLKG